jgi:CHAT domain-containing protein
MAHGASRLLTRVSLLLSLLTATSVTLAASIDEFHRIVQLAKVYQQNGYRQQALNILRDAEPFDVSAKARANLDLDLAQLYFELGQYPRADAKLKVLTGDAGLPTEIKISALNLSAALASTLNRPDVANRNYLQAAALARKEMPAYTLVTQTNYLRHTLDYSDWRTGETIAAEILPAAKQLNATAGEIEVRISAAELLMRLANLSGKPSFRRDAINLLIVATEHAILRDLPRLQSFALGYHGQALLDAGDIPAALSKLSQASFLASSSNAFESTYLWQWQTARGHRLNGDTRLAIAGYQTAIKSLEYVRQDLITGSPFTFPQKIQPLFAELSSLLLNEARLATNTHDQQKHLRQVQGLLEQAKSAELQDYFQNDCVIPDETVDLNQIADATAVIYPVVLEDRLEILVNIGNVIHQYRHPIGARDLESLVNEFRDNLQRDQGDDEYLLIGQELHQMIFADAEPLLAAEHIDTLLVIPDASLRTIPFSALHDGKAFLIEKYAIATTPGINLTLPKPLDVQQANFFAGGISDAVQGFSGLPGVPVELARLKDGYGAEVLQDRDFNRSAVQSQLASENYSIVHIATHGHFDSNPQESFLLAYDDKLTMDLLEESIGSRRQAGNPLELLVLSACETAVGDNRAALGLAGVALKAGARSAVATLWQISDAATVEIIQAFYDQSNHPAQTKAKALRSAQQRLIASERFYHPSDWAPFLLIGNWL